MSYLAFLMGPTVRTYEKWCLANSVDPVIEKIGEEEDGSILWIGNKQPERVILYLHGGGYYLPMADYSLKFWAHVRNALKEQDGIDVSVAILDYSKFFVQTSADERTWTLTTSILLRISPNSTCSFPNPSSPDSGSH